MASPFQRPLLSALRSIPFQRSCIPSTKLPTKFLSFRPRHFTTSIPYRVHPSNRIPHGGEKAAPGAPQSTTAEQSSYAFLKGLSTKRTPTILYQAPSHFWFYVASWSSGLCLIGWITVTAPAAFNQPEGVPAFVGYTLIAANVLIGSMGMYLITKTPGIVNTIRVLPARAVVAPVRIPVKGTAAPAVGASPVAPQIEFEVKRMLPFLSDKKIVTTFDKVQLKNRLSLPSEYVPELQRQAGRREEELRRQELDKFDKEHVMTMPFRRLGRASAAFFRGVKTAWTDMGFGRIQVDGKWYKVDVTKGFAHDGFRSLEKIVKVQS